MSLQSKKELRSVEVLTIVFQALWVEQGKSPLSIGQGGGLQEAP